MSGLGFVVYHGETPVFERISEAEKADRSHREVQLRPRTLLVAVSLGVALACCHARGDEPASAQEGVADRSPRFLARIRDRWGRRARVMAQPKRSESASSPAAPAERTDPAPTGLPMAAPVEGIAPPHAQSRMEAPTAIPAVFPLYQGFSGTGDESVRRAQAVDIPSQAAGQPATAAPRPSTSPAQAAQSRTAPTPPSPSASPAAGPPSPATAPAQPSTAAATPSQASRAEETSEAAASTERGEGFGESSSFGQGGDFNMIGDQAPILAVHPFRQQAFVPRIPTPPPLPRPGQASSFVASVRGLKISENQSPAPQDRVFYSVNFFAEVNQTLNKKFEASVDGLRVYREILGFEKTFNEGNGSLGMQLPINTVSANSTITGNFAKLAGTSTSTGDLSFFGKYIFARDPASGSLVSGGLAISTPNGPANFAGAKYLASLDSTFIQPFVGYIWSRDRFYLHGFSAIDTPASLRPATMLFNDVGIGYFVLKSTDEHDWLTAIAPTFEVHVNTPLTHGDYNNRNDPGAVPNVVDLTYGINFQFNRRSILTFGLVTPVTAPKPFDYEALILFNVFYGRTRRATQANAPMLGG